MANTNGNQIGYIFQFTDAAAAGRDPIVGSFFYFEMLLYDTLVNSVTPLSGFWAMIVQPFPLIPSLQNHPNLKLINNKSVLQPSVIVNNVPDLGFLQILTNAFCVYALPGLQLQPAPPPSGQSEPFPVVF